jgi:iron complex outermembrane receptor protein
MNTILIFLATMAQDTKYNFLLSLFFSLFFLSFSQVKDTTSVNKLDEVLVSAIQLQQNAGQL